MSILSFLFGTNKKLPYNKNVTFKRKTSDFKIEIGDKVNLWNQPNTNIVNLYAEGSSSGDGLVGTTNDKTLSYHLTNNQNLFFENKIVGISNDFIRLQILIYRDQIQTQKNESEAYDKWINRYTKPFNPKTNWELRFYTNQDVKLNNAQIETITKESLSKYYNDIESSIWLSDEKKHKLALEHKSRSADIEKTLRASFTGHSLEIKNTKQEDSWLYIEVGTI